MFFYRGLIYVLYQEIKFYKTSSKPLRILTLVKKLAPTGPHLELSSAEIVENVYVSNFQQNAMTAKFQPTHTMLCGVPGICKSTAVQNCFNVTLANCSDCSSTASGFFVFIVLCLGLAILLGNSLILAVYAQLYKKRIASKSDCYIASLAVADLLTGLQIFFVMFPNFAWTMSSTFEHISSQQAILQNSLQAIVGGIFYFFIYTSSIYHLLLLGAMRLYAIKWPYQYKQLTMQSVYFGIGVTWTLAAAVASFPAWFPQYFEFAYYHVIFLYIPSLIISPLSLFTPAIIVMVLFVVVPYVLMTLQLIFTAIAVRMQIMSSKKRLAQTTSGSNQDNFSKMEIAAFKTVSLMQLGFTATLVPLCVVVSLLFSGNLRCDSFSTSYMVCVYLSMTNSLVNVLVYSVRQKKFRSTAGEMFCYIRNFCSSMTQYPPNIPDNVTATHIQYVSYSLPVAQRK